ncbi:MAG TPA: hypothetical protein VE954_08735 [Oligoflexus sp.]|uniref:hypothetical protein n=1 Tax=Oligoflexus sp. TaxID=1971216 RepID=UPI002D2744BA|nr:hypothetical protein [Oligoflexus sp.]HYX33188.1 hypothetical protein [Oligoflexus sp.]
MNDYRTRLEKMCRDFRSTGSGYIYFDAITEFLDVYPEGVDYLIELFNEEDQESFKESLASLIIEYRPFVPAIEYLRDVRLWPTEDFENYEGYLQWVRDKN